MKKIHFGLLLFLFSVLLFNACDGESGNVDIGGSENGSVVLKVDLEGGEEI